MPKHLFKDNYSNHCDNYVWDLTYTWCLAKVPVACDQALWGALAAGREKEGELATTALWSLNSTPNSPVAPRQLSCQISANQGEAETSANVNKHVLRVMTSMPISSPPISISHRLFRCRYSNSRNVVASSPSCSRPASGVTRRVCSQAKVPGTNRSSTAWVGAGLLCSHVFCQFWGNTLLCIPQPSAIPTFQNCVWQGQIQQFCRKLHRVPKVWTPFLWCQYPGP